MIPVGIFACEAQPIVLEGLAKILTGSEEFCLLGSSQNFPEALDVVRAQHPEILLVDQSTGLKSVFQFLSDVRSTWPACHCILWVSDLSEMDCLRAIQAGARGILPKTAAVASVLDCLRAVGKGDVWMESQAGMAAEEGVDRRVAPRLTPREKEIVHQVCAGLKNKEIAEALNITPGTVKVHLMHIFEKTGVKDRFELAVHGRRLLGLNRAGTAARVSPTAALDSAQTDRASELLALPGT